MSSANHGGPPDGTLAGLVFHATGTNPMQCYQCGRCAAGCMQNVDGEMDISPTRMMRLIQSEAAFIHDKPQTVRFRTDALSAETPWLCAGCMACTTRCPQGIDIAGTMDVLRQEALKSRHACTTKRARNIQKLHQTFVDGATKRGRIHELSMIALYKLRTLGTANPLEDAALGPAMMGKGKLHLMPGKAVDMKRVKKATDAIRKESK